MANHQISILNGSVAPDNTGRCWFEPFDVIATNDIWRHLILRFSNPTSAQLHGFYGQFSLPLNYVGSAVIIPIWSCALTSGNARLRFTYRAVGGDNTESLDQTGNQEVVTITDAAGGAANRRMTPTMALTSANLAAGDTVEYLFQRLDDSGTDTINGDIVLHDLLLQYADA